MFRVSGFCLDMHILSHATAVLKLYNSRYLGKQGIVTPDPYIQAGFILCSPLPYDNRSAAHELTGKTLNPKPLGLAVSPVSGTSYSLFMCHAETP